MSSRNFVNEFADENRRQLHGDTIIRARITTGKQPGGAGAGSADDSQQQQQPVPQMEVELPEEASATFKSSSTMAWFKATATENKKAVLQVGVVFAVMMFLLFIFVTIATESGQAPPGRFPRLLFFTLDGVSVEEFRRAAALRRVPSMDFFASQSANCRPLSQDEYFREISSSSGSLFSSRFSECIMKDTASRVGTIYSLLTGTPFSPTAGEAVTLDKLSNGGTNFSTFMSEARGIGLTSAILGSTPLLTIPKEKGSAAQTAAAAAAGDNNNRAPVQCGILDNECVAHATAAKKTSSKVTIPPCTVPANAGDSLSKMITSSSSCNSAFQGLIRPNDTPDQIWRRLKYVIESEADVIYVQIPRDTVRYWMSLRPQLEDKEDGAVSSEGVEQSHFALDAALYDIDGIFSKLLRTVAIQSMEQGEQWLTLLSVSSPKEQEILLASNVIASGVRQDAGNVYEVSSLTPHRLYKIISEWLHRK